MWHRIGRQFRHPAGFGGAAMGFAMRFINRVPNRLAIEALGLEPDDNVLELGCGPGAALRSMNRRVTRGTLQGVDLSTTMLRQARRRNAGAIAAGHIVLHEASFDSLPLEDASVDKVVAINVVYFWDDEAAILREIGRVLRPGGILVVYATARASMEKWRFAQPATHRLFDASSLRACLRKGPFEGWPATVTEADVGFGIRGLIAVAGVPAPARV